VPVTFLNWDGNQLHDAAGVNAEAKLLQVFDKLARHGNVLVVVDQPTSIGAPPVARFALSASSLIDLGHACVVEHGKEVGDAALAGVRAGSREDDALGGPG